MTDIYNNTSKTTQEVYDAFNTLMFSNDKRVFNKMMKKVEIYMQVKDLVGDVVEFGVFKGAGLALFLKLKQMYEPNSLMKVIGFDYFQSDKLLDSLDGINKQGMADVLARAPSADLLVDSVNTRLLPLDKDNYMLVQGDAVVESKRFSQANPGLKIKLLYMDLDLGAPTYKVLKELWGKVAKGGIVVFDEYAYHIWDESVGVDQFLKEIEGEYLGVNTMICSPSFYIVKLVI
jgi:hypothetical protein